MSGVQHERKVFSLLEVTQSIQRTLADRYGSVFWVKAEMNKLNHYPRSGHCYPDLVEKKDGKVIAQLRSTLWKDDFNRINHNFLQVLKSPLKEGITMLCCARIIFDPIHGLSLRIMDIDPVFSLGELEREKLETIDQLKNAGIFEQNKSLKLPLLPQRIAVISVETSKGFADFQKVVNANPYGYAFFQVLFPAVLQGERAVSSILFQLKRIRKVLHHFDVVAIIRGGGGEVGLSCFNHYELNKAIATFPIPVITGIGHATNETVAEMVAHKNAITPTDLANYLIEKFHQYANPVQQAREKLIVRAKQLLREQKNNVSGTAKYLRSVTNNTLAHNRHDLNTNSSALVQDVKFFLHEQRETNRRLLYNLRKDTLGFVQQHAVDIRHVIAGFRKDISTMTRNAHQDLAGIEKTISNLSPDKVLKRGFSITLSNGKAVKSIDDVTTGATLTTILPDGSVISEVKTKNITEDQ